MDARKKEKKRVVIKRCIAIIILLVAISVIEYWYSMGFGFVKSKESYDGYTVLNCIEYKFDSDVFFGKNECRYIKYDVPIEQYMYGIFIDEVCNTGIRSINWIKVDKDQVADPYATYYEIKEQNGTYKNLRLRGNVIGLLTGVESGDVVRFTCNIKGKKTYTLSGNETSIDDADYIDLESLKFKILEKGARVKVAGSDGIYGKGQYIELTRQENKESEHLKRQVPRLIELGLIVLCYFLFSADFQGGVKVSLEKNEGWCRDVWAK